MQNSWEKTNGANLPEKTLSKTKLNCCDPEFSPSQKEENPKINSINIDSINDKIKEIKNNNI